MTLPRCEGDVKEHELDKGGAAAWFGVMLLGEHSSWASALKESNQIQPANELACRCSQYVERATLPHFPSRDLDSMSARGYFHESGLGSDA